MADYRVGFENGTFCVVLHFRFVLVLVDGIDFFEGLHERRRSLLDLPSCSSGWTSSRGLGEKIVLRGLGQKRMKALTENVSLAVEEQDGIIVLVCWVSTTDELC